MRPKRGCRRSLPSAGERAGAARDRARARAAAAPPRGAAGALRRPARVPRPSRRRRSGLHRGRVRPDAHRHRAADLRALLAPRARPDREGPPGAFDARRAPHRAAATGPHALPAADRAAAEGGRAARRAARAADVRARLDHRCAPGARVPGRAPADQRAGAVRRRAAGVLVSEQVRPDGIPGVGFEGPFAVGSYAKALQARMRERARVQLFGEVFNMRRGRGAKVYFELRDGDGALPCSMWRTDFEKLGPAADAVADGAQIVVAGGPDYYPGSRTSSPSFSFQVTGVRVAGEGDLLAQLDRLRKALAAEGLFEPQKALR